MARPAGVGQPHRSHAALDQPGAGVPFEGGDLLADRRLGELERARWRAEAEGLEATFVEGDPGDLPFPDGSFDVVLSAPDALSASDQGAIVGELLRVCRPGGRIGMVGWTPAATWERSSAPSAGTSRGRWAWGRRRRPAPAGTGARLRELLEVAGRFDVSEDDTLVLRLDYLEVVARKPLWR